MSSGDLGNSAQEGAAMQSNFSLKNSIATLTKLRNAHYSQLDASVLKELDEMIIELKRQDGDKNEIRSAVIPASRILELVSQVLVIVTNIVSLMK